jgi:hypothetical protein
MASCIVAANELVQCPAQLREDATDVSLRFSTASHFEAKWASGTFPSIRFPVTVRACICDRSKPWNH